MTPTMLALTATAAITPKTRRLVGRHDLANGTRKNLSPSTAYRVS